MNRAIINYNWSVASNCDGIRIELCDGGRYQVKFFELQDASWTQKLQSLLFVSESQKSSNLLFSDPIDLSDYPGAD